MLRTFSLATILAAAIAIPAIAQVNPAPAPTAPVTSAPSAMKLTLTADQAKSWIDKLVYSSDGKKAGEVAAFARGTDNTVTEMHIDIGGFLGLGETRVRLTPAQFKFEGDRVLLNMTAVQAGELPKVTN